MDLFNNCMVNNALKALSSEQIDYYKKFGESLYGNINFEDSKLLNNIPPPMVESVAYIEEGIKAGLSPSDLTEDEVVILSQAYGDKWYERYGFKEHEVPESGLSLDMKKGIEEMLINKITEVNKKTAEKTKKKKNNKLIK